MRVPLSLAALILASAFGECLWASDVFSYRYENKGPYQVRCHESVSSLAANPVDKVKAHLELPTGLLTDFLSTITKLPVWKASQGFIIHGSRAHKLWGDLYDLDIMLVPHEAFEIDGESLQENEALSFISNQYDIYLDVTGVAPASLGRLMKQGQLPRLSNEIEQALLPRLVELEQLAQREQATRSFASFESIEAWKREREAFSADLEKQRASGNPFLQWPQTGDFEFNINVRRAFLREAQRRGHLKFFNSGAVFIFKDSPELRLLYEELRQRGFTKLFFIKDDDILLSY